MKQCIIGACSISTQPKAFEKLKTKSLNFLTLCLEHDHINMAITKVMGFLRTRKIKHLIFASVNNSPHCIQIHYIQNEISKYKEFEEIKFTNYILYKDDIFEISKEVISFSKDLIKLQNSINVKKQG